MSVCTGDKLEVKIKANKCDPNQSKFGTSWVSGERHVFNKDFGEMEGFLE